MEAHPSTAVLLSCPTCGLVRVCDDYTSAHARGAEHTRLSGHQGLKYEVIQAPERLQTPRDKTTKGNEG